ncbi:hypothetical protein L0Y65_05380 [Candidatus Micrarchaeota archaeon]|nr:hypothetical protein [Candidatus Micrarchaeota archaeon]
MARDNSYRIKEDDGKNTILLIAGLLILIFIVGGGLIYMIAGKGAAPPIVPSNQSNQTPQNQTGQTGQNNTGNQTQVCGDACLFDAAVLAGNASACPLISSEGMEQACYVRLSNISLEACKAVANATMMQSCITAFAVAWDNITLCDLLVQGRDACRNAADPCINATDVGLCRALDAGEPSLCAGTTACLLDYSMMSGDESGCSLIPDAVVSTACKSAVEYSDRCASLVKDAERDLCYELFAIYANDAGTCTQISFNSLYVYECFTHFAIRQRDLKLCDNERIDLNDKWGCYRNYSLATGDISGCRAIDPLASTNQFLCAFEFAKKYGDPSACEIIEIPASRKTCYEGAIIYSNANLDWRNCMDVTNFVWKNKCYTESAKLYADVSICNNIAEEFAKETCIGAFAANQTG